MAKQLLPQSEVKDIFEQFLNDNSMWVNFKNYVEEKGYDVTELGFEED